MARARKLAGDLLAEAMRGGTGLLGARDRNGGTDPESVAAFLAYDLPFRTEPAVNVAFPPPADETAQGQDDG